MGHTWKNGSHLQKLVTLRKKRTRSEKSVTLRKLGHIGRMGHTWKNWSNLEKIGFTLAKNGSHVQTLVTLGKKVTLKTKG